MEKIIKETTRLLLKGTLTKEIADKILLDLHSVSKSAFTILNKGVILENILFKTPEEARNYIKMKYPKRNFKEPEENVFVCAHYGTKFIIQEQHYR